MITSNCAECGNTDVLREEKEYQFPYGIGENKVELCAVVPVYTCKKCNFSWIDCEAEDIIDKEIKRHIQNNEIL